MKSLYFTNILPKFDISLSRNCRTQVLRKVLLCTLLAFLYGCGPAKVWIPCTDSECAKCGGTREYECPKCSGQGTMKKSLKSNSSISE